jgi:hypothetical protein
MMVQVLPRIFPVLGQIAYEAGQIFAEAFGKSMKEALMGSIKNVGTDLLHMLMGDLAPHSEARIRARAKQGVATFTNLSTGKLETRAGAFAPEANQGFKFPQRNDPQLIDTNDLLRQIGYNALGY